MSLNFDDLKEFLSKNINSDMFYSPVNLYNGLVTLEKGDNASSFDRNRLNEIFEKCIYRYNANVGLHNIGIAVPFKIDPNLSFEEFCEEFHKYDAVSLPSEILENDTLYKRLHRYVISRVLGHDEWGGWTFLDYAKIQGDGHREKNETRKIYLSVDNKDLHRFGLLLLDKCDELGIKYHFKLNADERYRRADNVVIYTSDDDFSKYISAVEEIKEENPDISFGRGNLLAYPYNDYIRVAPFDKNPELGSHSSILCDKIFDLCYTEKNFDKSFQKIETLMTESLSETAEFCEKVRKNKSLVKPLSEDERKKLVCVNETLNVLRGLTPTEEVKAAIKSFEDYLKQNFPQYTNKKDEMSVKKNNDSLLSSATGKKK